MAQGMRATVSVPLLSQWKCSACGAENVREQQISGYGRTNNYDEFLARKKAQEDLEWKLKNLQSPDAWARYDEVCFDGKCAHCGNREPWGKTQSTLIHILQLILILASLVSVINLWPVAYMWMVGITEGMIVYAIPALIVAGCWAALLTWKIVRKNKVQNLICQLPVESLPVLQLIQPKRPEAPERTAVSAPKQNASDYTEEELKQLPTWKRLEIMKQAQMQNEIQNEEMKITQKMVQPEKSQLDPNFESLPAWKRVELMKQMEMQKEAKPEEPGE